MPDSTGRVFLLALADTNGVWKRPLSESRTGVTSLQSPPTRLMLEQNYPNPFNPTTTIRYGLPWRSYLNLVVYNTLGQLVALLVNGEIDAGYHEVTFDASTLPSGAYFCRVQTGSHVESKRLLSVR
jgi:hypothetical protein